MKKGFIILVVIVIISLYIVNKVTTAKQLEFTVGVPQKVSAQGGSITFDLPLNSNNISRGSINIKSADFDVLTNGKYLGKARITEPYTISPGTTTTLIAHVTIGYFDVLTAAGSIINLFKSGKINLSIDGLIYAEFFQVPYKGSFDFDTKQFSL